MKGQAIYAFVTLSEEAGKTGDREQIKKALVGHIRSQIGAQLGVTDPCCIPAETTSECPYHAPDVPPAPSHHRRVRCARGHPLGARCVSPSPPLGLPEARSPSSASASLCLSASVELGRYHVHFVNKLPRHCSGLPKTRSGKIMRRILRKIADHKDDDLG